MTGKTTRESLSDSLRARIVSGELRAGHKLPSERELAEQWELSRPAVREVLHGLSESDYVVVHPGRGAFVREPRPADAAKPLSLFFRRAHVTAANVVEARLMIETEAAGLAASRGSVADLTRLEQRFAALEEARGPVERARLDLSFHAQIAHCSGNPVVETMFASVAKGTLELMLRSLLDPTVADEGLPLHHDLWIAISSRRPDEAKEMMQHHLTVARRRYGDDLDRSLDEVARQFIERELGTSISIDAIVASVFDGR